MKKALLHVSQCKYNLGGMDYKIGKDVGTPGTACLLGSFDSKLFHSLGTASSISGKMNKNLQAGAFGLSCGLEQYPFILFKSEFLLSLRDEEEPLSYNLK